MIHLDTTPSAVELADSATCFKGAFSLTVDQRTVPGMLWMPRRQPLGLVLACHGGGGHKESPAICAIVDLLTVAGYAVAAIDGPVHGDRRADKSRDPDEVRPEFRAAWRDGVGHSTMAADWRATLDMLQSSSELRSVPAAYIGVSMGTAYGLPFLAVESRIQAAAIGLWSTTYPNSAHLVGYARQVRAAVWFTQQWDDQLFDRAATLELFDAIGSSDKRLVAYPGPHLELEGERLADAVAFLLRKLASA